MTRTTGRAEEDIGAEQGKERKGNGKMISPGSLQWPFFIGTLVGIRTRIRRSFMFFLSLLHFTNFQGVFLFHNSRSRVFQYQVIRRNDRSHGRRKIRYIHMLVCFADSSRWLPLSYNTFLQRRIREVFLPFLSFFLLWFVSLCVCVLIDVVLWGKEGMGTGGMWYSRDGGGFFFFFFSEWMGWTGWIGWTSRGFLPLA